MQCSKYYYCSLTKQAYVDKPRNHRWLRSAHFQESFINLINYGPIRLELVWNIFTERYIFYRGFFFRFWRVFCEFTEFYTWERILVFQILHLIWLNILPVYKFYFCILLHILNCVINFSIKVYKYMGNLFSIPKC